MKDDIRIQSNLDTDLLKIIAALTMLLDHIGKIIYPEAIIFQLIGRISFPLFAYCLVVGCLYTKDIYRYIKRLTLFGVISQPFFMLAFGSKWYDLNIFMTLLIGVIIISLLKDKRFILATIIMILSIILDISYGLNGILLMVIFYEFKDKKKISLLFATSLLIVPLFYNLNIYIGSIAVGAQGFAVLSIPLIYMNTESNIKINKYMFYGFYPIHLFVLSLISLVV